MNPTSTVFAPEGPGGSLADLVAASTRGNAETTGPSSAPSPRKRTIHHGPRRSFPTQIRGKGPPSDTGGGRRHGSSRNGPPRLGRNRETNFTHDSNGPSGKIRGNAHQLAERYAHMANEAKVQGDHIHTERLRQYAEHYHRLAHGNT